MPTKFLKYEDSSSEVTKVTPKDIHFLLHSLQQLVLVYSFIVLLHPICCCWPMISWLKWRIYFLLF